MKTIKMDYFEFEKLHEVINEQEKVIKELKESHKYLIEVYENHIPIPRHCFGEDIYDNERYSINVPVIKVGDKAKQEMKFLKERYDSLREKYDELYSQATYNIEKEIRDDIEKEIRKEIKEEELKKKKRKNWLGI